MTTPPPVRGRNLYNPAGDMQDSCTCIEMENAFRRLGHIPLITFEDRAWVIRFRGIEIGRNPDSRLAFGQARRSAAEQANP